MYLMCLLLTLAALFKRAAPDFTAVSLSAHHSAWHPLWRSWTQRTASRSSIISRLTPCWRETKRVGPSAWVNNQLQSSHSQCLDCSCWTPVVEVPLGSVSVSVLQSSVRDQKKLLVENSKLKKDIEQLRTQLQDKQRRRTCTLNSGQRHTLSQNNLHFWKREGI